MTLTRKVVIDEDIHGWAEENHDMLKPYHTIIKVGDDPESLKRGSPDEVVADYCNANGCDLFTSVDSGIVKLDVPQRLLEGIFMVLVDGNEWDDLLITQNTLSVNFPHDTSSIEIRGSYYITPYYVGSHLYTGVCDVAHDPPYSYILSPLKQIKNGVEPWMVQCNDGLTLLLKPAEFTKPACVTDDTANKLIERHWSISVSRGESENEN